VQGVLVEPHHGQPVEVEVEPEQLDPERGALVVGEGLEPLHERAVRGQRVAGLLVGLLGVPGIPDRLGDLTARRVHAGEPGVEVVAHDLGTRTEVGHHLGDRPLDRVGLGGDLVRRQRLDQSGEAFVGGAQGGDGIGHDFLS
jgi:hypothetical protein